MPGFEGRVWAERGPHRAGVQAEHPKLAKAQNTLDPTDGCFCQLLALGVGVMP